MKGVWKFVGGCFVGAASAIVMSPKSGSELRRQMALGLAHGLERAAGESSTAVRHRVRRTPDTAGADTGVAPVVPGASVRVEVPRTESAPATEAPPASKPEGPEARAPEPARRESAAPAPAEAPLATVALVAPEPGGPEPAALRRELDLPEQAGPEVAKPEPASPVGSARPEAAVLAAAAQSAAAIGLEPSGVETDREEIPAGSGIDDLRARIEQTKAAVREALERPFGVEESDGSYAQGSAATAADATALVEAWEPTPVLAPTPAEDSPPAFVVPEPELALAADAPGVEPAPATPGDLASTETAEPQLGVIEEAEEPGAGAPEMAAAKGASEQAFVPVVEAAAPVAAFGDAFAEGRDDGAWMTPDADASPADEAAGATPPEPAVEEPGETPVDMADEQVATVAGIESAVPEELPVSVSEPAPEPPKSDLDRAVSDAFALPEEAHSPAESTVVDQAEMRRRIEETRSRLKAKAFDALASGEAPLLRHGTSEQPVASPEADEPLDDEVRAAIDRSLTQDDY